ncbi:MAG: cytochrome c oxidase assembly protein [Actinobacteria bacterium]|nr:cytochrome c oxidase assembly protein [Actinomycetota bacterium]MBO0784859.1 cytochrome c oxidase assembly protein [Actinomycetota bacterium]
MNLVVSHWSANPAVLAAVAVVAAVYLRGAWALRPVPAQAVAFSAGLLLVVVALAAPVGYWARHYMWVRSVQDLLLAVVVPSLIVLGAPWEALARGIGQRLPPRPDRDYQSPAWLSWPVAVTVAFNVAWWAWHVPALYDAALRHPAVYAAQTVIYLGVGIAFWLQLIGSGPVTPRFPPLPRVMLITGTMASGTVLAMMLAFGSGLLYPAYLPAGRRPGSVLWDQNLAGAVLWLLALPPLIITAVALLIRWLNEENRQALAAGLDRLLTPSRPAWPSRPGRT